MRIGVDLSNLDPGYAGGVKTFSLGLTSGLAHASDHADRLIVLVSSKNEEYVRSALRSERVEYLKVRVTRATALLNRLVALCAWFVHDYKLRYRFDKIFRRSRSEQINRSVDIVLTPTVVLNYYALRVPSVVCIHDIQHEYHPEHFSRAQRIFRWAPYRLSCWAAASIQVSSHYIAKCLMGKFSIRPEKVFLAYEGVDVTGYRQGERIKPIALGSQVKKGTFIFYPAQLWAHKNHLLLVDALAEVRSRLGRELVCVLTGRDYGYWKAIARRVNAHQLKSVYYLGVVSRGEILWLYANCLAVMALGLHESSSLPAREGAVFGKPIICSNIPPNVEAAEYLDLTMVDGQDSRALGMVLSKLATGGTDAERSALAVEKVIKLDWTEIARVYLAEFHRLVSVEDHR